MSDKRTILIVEDNPMNLKLARDVLEAKGYRVVVAENGEDGVALAAAERPDLVLMDIQLPDIDGLEVWRRYSEHCTVHQLEPLPCIALTASAFDVDRRDCEAAGMQDFLSKPVNRQALLQALSPWTTPK